jgi:hypothetical protein
MIIYNTTMDLISKEVSKEEEKQFSHRIQYQDIFLLWQPSCIFYPQKNIQWYIHLKIGFIQSVVSEKILISIVFSLGTNVKCRDHRTILLVRWFMVFNATFNISVISWQSVLLVEETGKPRENQWPVPSDWQTLSHNVVRGQTDKGRCHINLLKEQPCVLSEKKNYVAKFSQKKILIDLSPETWKMNKINNLQFLFWILLCVRKNILT